MSDETKRAIPQSFGDMKQLPPKIPLRFVKLRQPMDIPGEQVCERIKCDPKDTLGNQRRWTVNYITALESFEVMYHPSDMRQPVEVALLHVSCALQWWPIAL